MFITKRNVSPIVIYRFPKAGKKVNKEALCTVF